MDGTCSAPHGIQGNLPLPQVDPAFANVDVIAHHQRKILNKNAPTSLSGHGVRGTTGALFHLIKDLPPDDVKDVCISSECRIVTI